MQCSTQLGIQSGSTLVDVRCAPDSPKFAGEGAAYLNGGFGALEFAFTLVVTYFAYRGLRSYNFIGIGWLCHSGWDVLHHLYGNPIVPFAPSSSLGCAICDPVIAIWCFAGAPSIYDLFRRKLILRSQ
jgi:hypothetical protein